MKAEEFGHVSGNVDDAVGSIGTAVIDAYGGVESERPLARSFLRTIRWQRHHPRSRRWR